MSVPTPSISTETINEKVLSNFQKHRQLTMRESEFLTLELLTLLCDSRVSDPETLKYLAKFLTPEAYDDLIEERNINNLCGYPLCHKPPERNKNDKSQITRTGAGAAVHPYTVSHQHDAIIQRFLWENNPYAYLSKFCSKVHYRSSQLYQIQLSDEALFARTGIHLLNDTLKTEELEKNRYSIMLYEDLLRERSEEGSSENDIKAVIKGIKRLGFQDSTADGEQSSEESKMLEEQLSKWLEEIKIVEDQNPSLIGDYGKSDE